MINIVTNNHSSPIHIQDFLEYIHTVIKSSGQDACYGIGEWKIENPNIVLEGGNSEFTQKMILAKKKYPDIKIFLVVTEFIKDGVLNSANINYGAHSNNIDHYSNESYWLNRTNDFIALLPFLNGLICLNSILYEQYRTVHPNVFYLPLLKINSLAKCTMNSQPKLYDFVFSGTITPYRDNIIKTLKIEGLNIATLDSNTPEYIRNTIHSRAKAVLGLRLNENTTTFSNMRAYYCLINKLPHIFEKVTTPCDMQEFVNFSKNNFISEAIKLINNNSFPSTGFNEFEKYSSKVKRVLYKNFSKWINNA